MVTIQESSTEVDDESFIKDDFTRAGDGLITTIEEVRRIEYSNKVTLTVSEPSSANRWTYDEGILATWDKDSCWLVKLAEKRGVGLENLDDLEGEEVYVEPSDNDSWSMHAEHPREMFDESEIEDSVSVEDRNILDSNEGMSAERDIELDCMKYESSGDYFVCQIDRMVEIERDGSCNIIEITVDTPYDEGSWQFKKPYDWDKSNTLVQLAESRNYGHGNFTSLVGDEVLVKRKDSEWVLNTENLREHRERLANNNSSVFGNTWLSGTLALKITIIFISVIVFMIFLFVFSV